MRVGCVTGSRPSAGRLIRLAIVRHSRATKCVATANERLRKENARNKLISFHTTLVLICAGAIELKLDALTLATYLLFKRERVENVAEGWG